MKVVTINGSSHDKGNTALALDTVSRQLEAQGIRTERINIGQTKLHGCIGCGVCAKQQNLRCSFEDDPVNDWITTMCEADGLVIGSPVYYAGINGALKSFMDRAFFVIQSNGNRLRLKVGAAVVAVRRGGALPAYEQINKYFSIAEMVIPSGNYWNMTYGMMPGEAAQDAEGIQNLEVLGANMAWLLKVMEHGKDAVSKPMQVQKARMNFIR